MKNFFFIKDPGFYSATLLKMNFFKSIFQGLWQLFLRTLLCDCFRKLYKLVLVMLIEL